MSYLRILFKSVKDFFRDGGLMLAGSISYFSMMALVPFCLFIVTVFGYFLGRHEELLAFFSSKLVSFFPAATSSIAAELKRIISFKGIGKVSFLIYGFLSYQLFASLEMATNVIFKTKEKRPFFISLILSVFIITFIMVLILISFGATSAIEFLGTLREVFPHFRIGKLTAFAIKYIVPFVMIFLTVMSIYKLFPRRKVRLTHAMLGAFFTAMLLEIAKNLFTLYVMKVAKLGTIYGPLSAFIIFLLWVFYSACIFLIGAEVVHNLGEKKLQGKSR